MWAPSPWEMDISIQNILSFCFGRFLGSKNSQPFLPKTEGPLLQIMGRPPSEAEDALLENEILPDSMPCFLEGDNMSSTDRDQNPWDVVVSPDGEGSTGVVDRSKLLWESSLTPISEALGAPSTEHPASCNCGQLGPIALFSLPEATESMPCNSPQGLLSAHHRQNDWRMDTEERKDIGELMSSFSLRPDSARQLWLKTHVCQAYYGTTEAGQPTPGYWGPPQPFIHADPGEARVLQPPQLHLGPTQGCASLKPCYEWSDTQALTDMNIHIEKSSQILQHEHIHKKHFRMKTDTDLGHPTF
ncbi:uncharacterized protein LOC110216856 isoform X2 [Phascolarctos cinereus]|uniref:Uncharacterized protein LOC110216856 isoform X2 n=1 Tax=Phascolarctos cinereus TaxID=38626 RepID=A0A6P5L938_PHACI|nr:uncharacterized protein LOC110216856 isoform X2 [Phascolarctos cinereus]XP_020854527.1 uncharacterized protein LOC110216856 isoform X2 [Phascolarctos cinereus]XP_020854528.1 uncharacterized protein LOC110216856 isoform X2 [Phascolarctos cinereus]